MTTSPGTADAGWEADGLRIQRISMPTPKFFLHDVCAYLVSAGDHHLLIDAGPDDDLAWPALEDGLLALGVRAAQIETVIVTHGHRDHFGNATRFRAAGARVLVHRLDAEVQLARAADPLGYGERLSAWLAERGVPADERRAWVGVLARPERIGVLAADGWLDDDRIPLGDASLRIEWAPGHTPGQVIIWAPGDRIVFAADHVLPTVAPNVGSDADTPDDPLRLYLDSLRRLAGRPGVTALPGHGPAFNLATRANELLAHQEDRGRRTVAAVAAGAADAYSVASTIWDRATWEGFSPFLKCNAIRALAAQLTYLERVGQLHRRNAPVDHFEAAERP